MAKTKKSHNYGYNPYPSPQIICDPKRVFTALSFVFLECLYFEFFCQFIVNNYLMNYFTNCENVKSKCKKSLENFLSGIILAK